MLFPIQPTRIAGICLLQKLGTKLQPLLQLLRLLQVGTSLLGGMERYVKSHTSCALHYLWYKLMIITLYPHKICTPLNQAPVPRSQSADVGFPDPINTEGSKAPSCKVQFTSQVSSPTVLSLCWCVSLLKIGMTNRLHISITLTSNLGIHDQHMVLTFNSKNTTAELAELPNLQLFPFDFTVQHLL